MVHSYNGFNQLLSVTPTNGAPTTFAYDGNGNQTSKTDSLGTTTYTYNLDNRLVGISAPSGMSSSYEYDANGLRTKKTDLTGTRSYLLDGLSVAAEYAPDASKVAWYTQSLARIDEVLSVVNGQGKYWYETDALGSTYAMTNAAGAVVSRSSYDVFGERSLASLTDVEQPFGFTGREHDGSGLVYSRARYLRVEAGMWTSADPVGMPDGPARYLYARARPTLRRDPMGLFATPIHNYILTEALQNGWGVSRVDILKRASADVDSLLTGQSASGSYQHAMRAPDQTVTEAEELFNAFIVDKMAGAALMWTRSQCDAADEQAIYLLGQGMHAVADQFTPMHTGFQIWYGIEPGKWVMSQYGEDLYHHFAEDDQPGDPAVMSATHAVREYFRTFRDVVRIARLTGASQPDQFRGLAAGMLGIPLMCGIGGLTCG